MAKKVEITIYLDDSDAGTVAAKDKYRITWGNNTTNCTMLLSLPDCVTPQDGPISLDPGDFTRSYNVKYKKEFDGEYVFVVDCEKIKDDCKDEKDDEVGDPAPRTGVIDVGP